MFEPDAASFLLGVLKHHSEWEDKAGCGVAAVLPRCFESWSGATTGLVLRRVDGSEIDISWVVALLPGGKTSAKANVAAAARFEVVAQRDAASHAVPFGAPCPLCGEPLAKGNRHVDHTPPNTFDALLDCWLALEEGISYEDVKLVEVNNTQSQFADRALAQRWAEYHETFAALRVIHKHENLSRGAGR